VTRDSDHLPRGNSRLAARQEPSVGRPQRRSMDLTTQDRQLMTEHDDLKLLRVCRSDQKRDQLQDSLEGDVKDGQDHGSPLRAPQSRGARRIGVVHNCSQIGGSERAGSLKR
jgi:hypothetical protein